MGAVVSMNGCVVCCVLSSVVFKGGSAGVVPGCAVVMALTSESKLRVFTKNLDLSQFATLTDVCRNNGRQERLCGVTTAVRDVQSWYGRSRDWLPSRNGVGS